MSQPAAPLDPNRRKVVLSICHFLTKEIGRSDEPDFKESLTVAVQCLEAAYGINYGALIRDTEVSDLWSALIPMDEKTVAEAETFKRKGNALVSIGSFRDAIESYTRAIQLNPQNAVYYCNRAAALCRLGYYNDAVADCKSAVKLDPSYSKAYGRLGLAYLNMKAFPEAVEAYGTAVRLDPTNEMYKQNFDIAMDHFRKGDEQNVSPERIDEVSINHVQSAINQIVNNPHLMNMASEMLSDETVRNAMTGIIQMRTQNESNPSMENLLRMGHQLAHQMHEEHPDFIQNLRQQFADHANNSANRNEPHNNQQDRSPDSHGNA